jgi:ABC-type transport system involved in multi-copper enzyme maturation permease subunit
MLAHMDAMLYRALRFNPCVTVNELRMRLRGIRPFLVLLFYAAIASLTVLLALLSMGWRSPMMYGPRAVEFGRTAFAVLANTQLTLILLILPAYGAGAITMEREKRTLEMLRAALVTPTDLVTGKLLAILGFGLMLLLASLPVAAWCIMLGGLAPEEIISAYVYLFLVAVFVTSLGLMYSARVRRSMGAVVTTYATLIGFYILAVVVPGILSIPMGPRHRGVFGFYGATAVILVLALISGWLAFLAIRWLIHRLMDGRREVLTGLLAAVPALGLAAYLMSPTGQLYLALESTPVSWMMALNPYATLMALLYDQVAAEITRGWTGGGGHAAAAQAVILQISGGISLLLAAFLWTVAIRSLRAEQ